MSSSGEILQLGIGDQYIPLPKLSVNRDIVLNDPYRDLLSLLLKSGKMTDLAIATTRFADDYHREGFFSTFVLSLMERAADEYLRPVLKWKFAEDDPKDNPVLHIFQEETWNIVTFLTEKAPERRCGINRGFGDLHVPDGIDAIHTGKQWELYRIWRLRNHQKHKGSYPPISSGDAFGGYINDPALFNGEGSYKVLDAISTIIPNLPQAPFVVRPTVAVGCVTFYIDAEYSKRRGRYNGDACLPIQANTHERIAHMMIEEFVEQSNAILQAAGLKN